MALLILWSPGLEMRRRYRPHRRQRGLLVKNRPNLEPGWDQIRRLARQMALYFQALVPFHGGLYLVYLTGWNGSIDTAKLHMAWMRTLALAGLAGKEEPDKRLLLHHLDQRV
jgi:hypothetical protein